MTDINEILAKLNKKTAEKFILASQVENRLLETPSLKLTKAIGGYGYGRINILWGNRSAGKTMHAIQAAANAQRNGDGVGWIDAERNFDPTWAARLGFDNSQALVSPIASFSDAADAGVDLIKSGVNVLVVDSYSSLLPTSYMDDGELKDFSKTQQIGTLSKNLGSMLNMWNGINQDVCIILISQVRTAISQVGGIPAFMGGKAADHMPSAIIKLWSNPNPKEAIKGQIQDGDRIVETAVGRKVVWTVDKNRGPGMHESDDYDMYFKGDNVGIDIIGEIVDVAADHALVKKSGNWYSFGDMKPINGRKDFVAYIRENPEIKDHLYGKILDKSI